MTHLNGRLWDALAGGDLVHTEGASRDLPVGDPIRTTAPIHTGTHLLGS